MDQLQIETDSVRAGTERVSIRGDLDLQAAHRVERALLTCLGNGATNVIVDVTGCRFVDSTALGQVFSPRIRRFGTRFSPVTSDHNMLQLLGWRAGAKGRVDG